MTVIDTYFSKLEIPQRDALERVRSITKKLVPDAEEVISYGVPTMKYKGKYLIYFAAFKDHMSIFPGPHTDAIKNKLKDFKVRKGTIQFTLEKQVPEEIIKELVLARKAELDK